MDSFNCNGWLFMTIFEGESFAQVQLKHTHDHVIYSEMHVPPEVQEYVENNFKMSTTAIWNELLKKYPNPGFKRRSIYNIAANARRKQWYRDPDELKSAKILLEESKTSKYSIADVDLPEVDGFSGLAFSLPNVMLKFGGRVREVSLDSAWNTNASHYELYALLGEVYGSGCPLGYLLLQSPKSGEEGAKESYIRAFLEHFKKHYELNPSFTLTDKDLSEINAFLEVFPDAKHQLCFWHCLRAVKQRLSILRRPPKFYNVTQARNEFGDAINKDFVPIGQVSDPERVVS
ncbi:hypothetical protein K435DRAFT_692671 [Dendrothele bispora CBS 962.96]|uniref:MULE transposase domain-containing protein n=1 Tax=Dendrothele bispora (strain CBS 962.96) TaxID=1314807 RepID=A0A4S8KQQ4_DENBC|nr:hypothetical protein K435DRAFT_701106 [Dendrothele bispora CBS 962.96]THU81890.1 hypothetical protein K435DRAFT_692671 [Dendrothele bispora CBS 962.96]